MLNWDIHHSTQVQRVDQTWSNPFLIKAKIKLSHAEIGIDTAEIQNAMQTANEDGHNS
jgi:hypothetical protein